jgi:GTP:adenosylcobinamide-phosphate guanylyltransferase
MVRQVIVQAGGKGTRLEHYTWNKPKCLVPVNGKPLIYHAFDAFPGAHFVLILDYKAEVVRRFLETFPPPVPFTTITAQGSGTNSGISPALAQLPFPDENFALVWCDLKFEEPVTIEPTDRPIIGVTDAFPCRWRLDPARGLVEERSDAGGVMGLFAFPHRVMLDGLPEQGEFVQWLRDSGRPFEARSFNAVTELGTVAMLTSHWSSSGHTRFFNEIRFHGDRVIKRARVPAYAGLIADEIAWYKEAGRLGFSDIPELLSDEPMTLRRIDGMHPFELPRDRRGRAAVLGRIMDMFARMHALGERPASEAVVREVYLDKTLARLAAIPRLGPELASRESLRINGKLCPNILHPHHAALLPGIMTELTPYAFRFIHGDPTFSNTLVDGEGRPWLIDPRGRFGTERFFGDPAYDWAKLYYSAVGDYDNFNRRQFLLSLEYGSAELQINPGGWSHLRGMFHERLGAEMRRVQIIHALIWLSLAGYVQDDYDSILASFLNGLLVLEDALG